MQAPGAMRDRRLRSVGTSQFRVAPKHQIIHSGAWALAASRPLELHAESRPFVANIGAWQMLATHET